MHGVVQFLVLKPVTCAERGEFLAIGHELGAFAHIGAVDPENLIAGAGHYRVAGLVVRLVAFPHHEADRSSGR
jgi:hypothetical protein